MISFERSAPPSQPWPLGDRAALVKAKQNEVPPPSAFNLEKQNETRRDTIAMRISRP